MKLENPWIAGACQHHDISRNNLETYLQEQYGQLAEDLILEGLLKSHFAALGRPANSIRYLEVGANHPIQTSNTFLFHQKWEGSGVLVEANSQLILALQKVRKRDVILHRAIVPAGSPESVDLKVASNAELSSIDAEHIASFGQIGSVASTEKVPTALLDSVLRQHFKSGLDLLSIDIEGLDLQVLKDARFAVRPMFIVTEPSGHYHEDSVRLFGEAMRAKGYAEIARTDYNLIFADTRAMRPLQHGRVASRPVSTFDIFDTLIARHCITPIAVFDLVEVQSGVEGFSRARQQAERDVERSDYAIFDIYRSLAAHLAVDAKQAHRLMTLEIEIERANVVPIANNVRRLDPESVLITDMYLPPDIIRMFLDKAGISTELPIVQTSHGKRSGRVWSALSRSGFDCQHLGDNDHSDFQTCLASGMKPEIQKDAEPTPAERYLHDKGLPLLAASLRSVRLMTYSADVPAWQRRLFFGLNLPVLITFAAVIRQFALNEGLAKVLFASRDCFYLKQVFDALNKVAGSPAPASIYWFTSRIARTAGSVSYLDYCRSLLQERAAIVDLCGTGASLSRLLADLGSEAGNASLILCERIDNAPMLAGLLNAYGLKGDAVLNIFDIVSTSAFMDNGLVEMMNLTPEGMVVGVEDICGNFVPIRDRFEFDSTRKNLLERVRLLASEACLHLRQITGPQLCEEILRQGPRLSGLLRDLSAAVPEELLELGNVFGSAHGVYDEVVLRRLGVRTS